MTAAAKHERTTSASASVVLAALLEARTGQRLGHDRAWRLDTTLRPLLRALSLDTPDELVALMLRGDDPLIADRIVDALVNNETSFFRDPAVFELVVDQVAALAAAAGRRRLKLWSAGCSTGQEPLSLAMALAERFEGTDLLLPEIVATDVSEAVIARGRTGRYTQFEIQRGLPMRRMLRWFDGQPDGDWIANPELLRMVGYRRLNLAATPWRVGGFDLILCRNVLMYLAPPVREAVYQGFVGALRPGGTLVLGAGETVLGQTRLFVPSRGMRGAYELAAARAAA